MLETYRLHTIHHEKIYIQCNYRNNLFMHKGQDQVNIEEVYMYVNDFGCAKAALWLRNLQAKSYSSPLYTVYLYV